VSSEEVGLFVGGYGVSKRIGVNVVEVPSVVMAHDLGLRFVVPWVFEPTSSISRDKLTFSRRELHVVGVIGGNVHGGIVAQ
jgi:hypothetical protein